MLANALPDIELNEEDKKNMAIWLYSELNRCEADRKSLTDLWIKIQKLYEKVELEEKKDFPFENAAMLMIPVVPTYVEQLHARIMNTLYAPEDPYTVRPGPDELQQYAKACRKWITWAVQNELNMEEVDYTLLLELLKLGNMVCKIIYTRETKTLYHYNETLEKYEPSIEIMKDNPEVIPLSINDFWFPIHARNLGEAEWRAHRIKLTWNEIKGRARDGRYDADAVRKLSSWWSSTPRDEYNDAVREAALVQPSETYDFTLFEVWCAYPLQYEPTIKGQLNDSLPIDPTSNILNYSPPIDLVGVYHRESQTFVRLQYNYYPLGLDPFEHETYIRREFQILGIGVGQMAYPFQIEVSTMHNQRLDNATVANTVMFKYLEDSTVGENIRVRPGGGIPVSKMDELEPFQIGQKYDSTIPEEKHTLSFLQERIGSRELEMDQASLSHSTATTTLALLEEKGRRLDNVIRTIRRFKRRVMLKCILLYQAHYSRDKLINILGQEDGLMVAQFLDKVKPQQIYDSMGIAVTATTSTTSKELDRQSKMALFNLLLTYYGQAAQYVGAIAQAPPQISAVFLEILQGLSTFVGEILDDFNLRNKNELLVDLSNLSAATQQVPAGLSAQAVQGGGMGAAPGNGAAPAASPPQRG